MIRRALFAAPLAAVLLAGPSPAAAQPWVVAPASDNAELITQLFWFTLVLATIVFVLVEGLLIYSSLRFRRHAPLPTREPPQIHGNTRLEVMWAAVPALILVGLFGITVSRLGDISTVPNDPNTLHVNVTGRQFQWEFDYGNSVKSTNELHIPVGQQIVFDVTSTDVIHSFWVPDLYGKIDANPGRVNRITFKAKQAGEYRGVCAELCGAGHGGMLFRVQAQPQSDFQQWMQEQKAPAAAAPAPAAATAAPQPNTGAPAGAGQTVAPPAPGAALGGQAVASPAASPAASAVPAAPAAPPAPAAPAGDPQKGATLIAQKGCGACHTVPGVQGAAGAIGPNLGGVASRKTIAGGAVPNNGPEDLKRWIMNPPAVKPGTQMPNLNVNEADATDIVAYLETLK